MFKDIFDRNKKGVKELVKKQRSLSSGIQILKNRTDRVKRGLSIYLNDLNSLKNRMSDISVIEKQLGITNQNLSEFARVLVEKYNQHPNEVKKEIHKFIFQSQFIIIDSWHSNELLLALDLQHKFKIHFWDAKLAATMISNNIKKIYTENTKDFDKIKGIKAINPFE